MKHHFNLFVLLSPLLSGLLFLVIPTNFSLLRAISEYSTLILVPGFIIYLVAMDSQAIENSLPSLLVYSNVFGLSVVVALSWVLVRLGLFELWTVILFEEIALVTLYILSKRRFTNIKLAMSNLWVDVAFLALIIVICTLVFLPVIALLLNGSLIGGDNAILAEVANVLAQLHSWPNISDSVSPYVSQADIAPGSPIIYALISDFTFTNPVYSTYPLSLFNLVLSTLGVAVLVERFTKNRMYMYGLSIVWLFGFQGSLYFYNLTLNYVVSLGSPDSIFAIPLILGALALLSALYTRKNAPMNYIFLLAIVASGVMLFDPLSFLMLGMAILCIGSFICLSNGTKWSLTSIIILTSTLVLLAPPYLNPYLAIKDSPIGSQGSNLSLYLYDPTQTRLFLSSFAGLALAVVGIITGIARGMRNRSKDALFLTSGIALAFIVYCVLSLTSVGDLLLGLPNERFLTYTPFAMIPLISIGLANFDEVIRNKYVKTAIVLILIVSFGVSTYTGIQAYTSAIGTNQSRNIFDFYQYEAAVWLSHQGNRSQVVVGDFNQGAGSVIFAMNFANHLFVFRDASLLSVDLHTRPPFNIPPTYANLMFTNPNFTNARDANSILNFTYYYLVKPWNYQQINAFSVLPYMSLVYSNPKVDIFEYTGDKGNQSYFIQAVQCNFKSIGVVQSYTPGALNSALSLSSYPNSISSSTSDGANFDGNYSSYLINVTQAGNYYMYINRDVYQSTEFSTILINGSTIGDVFYQDQGWSFGNPIHFDMQKGIQNLTLIFKGTAGWADPIDYIVIAPDS